MTLAMRVLMSLTQLDTNKLDRFRCNHAQRHPFQVQQPHPRTPQKERENFQKLLKTGAGWGCCVVAVKGMKKVYYNEVHCKRQGYPNSKGVFYRHVTTPLEIKIILMTFNCRC